jgi:Na+/H+ antiporter NhaD/arsenite permease-like protein
MLLRPYYEVMSRTLLAYLTLAVLCVPAVLIGQALDFGGLAWLVTLLLVMVLASLVDREGFYGANPKRPVHR